MDRKTFYGLATAVSCIFMAICVFLPYIVINWGGLSVLEGVKEETYSLWGTFKGFVILGLAVAELATVFLGLKNRTAMVAAAEAVFTGYTLAKDAMTQDYSAFQMSGLNNLMGELYGTKGGDVTMEFGFGFYLMIVALILMVFFGVAYTIIEDY